jgi:hypothetical protein
VGKLRNRVTKTPRPAMNHLIAFIAGWSWLVLMRQKLTSPPSGTLIANRLAAAGLVECWVIRILGKIMTEQELAQQREYRTVSYLVSTLANVCAGSPNKVIDLLTGYLWDEEEAGRIKAANMPGHEDV